MTVRVIRFASLYKPAMASLKTQLFAMTHPESTKPIASMRGSMVTLRSGMKILLESQHPIARHVAVVHEYGHVVGWCVSTSIISNPDEPPDEPPRSMLMIYVDPVRRREGIGRRLVEAIRPYEPGLSPSTAHSFFPAVGVTL